MRIYTGCRRLAILLRTPRQSGFLFPDWRELHNAMVGRLHVSHRRSVLVNSNANLCSSNVQSTQPRSHPRWLIPAQKAFRKPGRLPIRTQPSSLACTCIKVHLNLRSIWHSSSSHISENVHQKARPARCSFKRLPLHPTPGWTCHHTDSMFGNLLCTILYISWMSARTGCSNQSRLVSEAGNNLLNAGAISGRLATAGSDELCKGSRPFLRHPASSSTVFFWHQLGCQTP